MLLFSQMKSIMKKIIKIFAYLIVAVLAAALIFLNWPLYQRSVPAAENEKPIDVVVIGGGIMSMTLSTLLQELQPDWNIEAFERLDAVAWKAPTVGTMPAPAMPLLPN